MNDDISKLAEIIKRLTKKTYYEIKIEKEKPTLFDSKLGGLPYWTKDKEYPTNSEGNNLLLLAQINFDNYKFSSPLPEAGMLQFFVNNDDEMGLNFDNQIEQKDFRVVYHEKIDYDMTEEELKQLSIPGSYKDLEDADDNYIPFEKELKISFIEKIDNITCNDKDYNKFFAEAYNAVYNKDITADDDIYDVLEDDDVEKLNELLDPASTHHKLLGYPYFTQSDPRDDEKYDDYVLLLQIDTDSKYDIMWGDSGVGNFFITEKALIEKDFSKVLYNWDCC